MEARARRNNIIISGIAENRDENCLKLIRDFISNQLDLDPANMYITRAHTLGRINPNRGHKSRPIIANFRDFCDIEMIMSNARMLRGKPFSIDYDYPREIHEARSRLWPMYKQGKRDSPDARLTIAYPAKLIKNGLVINDELPEWSKNIGSNRLTQIKHIYLDSDIGYVPDRHSTTQTIPSRRPSANTERNTRTAPPLLTRPHVSAHRRMCYWRLRLHLLHKRGPPNHATAPIAQQPTVNYTSLAVPALRLRVVRQSRNMRYVECGGSGWTVSFNACHKQ